MAKLLTPFDSRAFELLRRVEADPDAAAKLLLLSAEYLRNRQPMPSMLADYIADAFESAAVKPREHRPKQLTDELRLTANNKRKANADWLDAYEVIKANPNKKPHAQAAELAKHAGIGQTKADELIKKASEYIEANE